LEKLIGNWGQKKEFIRNWEVGLLGPRPGIGGKVIGGEQKVVGGFCSILKFNIFIPLFLSFVFLQSYHIQ